MSTLTEQTTRDTHTPKYVSPNTHQPLAFSDRGLTGVDGITFGLLAANPGLPPIPDFLEHQQLGEKEQSSLEMYHGGRALQTYRNFLDWLFASFGVEERSFRASLAARLGTCEGGRILVTGCGLGDDLAPILSIIGATGDLYAQDLSPSMVAGAQFHLARDRGPLGIANVHFSAGDASRLPFPDRFFDGALHFGGINLFSDIGGAIAEMNRVVRAGGRVVFGDEGVAPWLKQTEYGKIAICNNALWSTDAPLSLLPPTAVDVHLSWVLGNCFYLVDFEVSTIGPQMNIDLVHKGGRGGSARTRFYGQLEGVRLETKENVRRAAAAKGISVHDWLEQAIAKAL